MILEVWYVFIIGFGIIAGRHFGRLVSLGVMLEMFQLGLLLFVSRCGITEPIAQGEFRQTP